MRRQCRRWVAIRYRDDMDRIFRTQLDAQCLLLDLRNRRTKLNLRLLVASIPGAPPVGAPGQRAGGLPHVMFML